MSPLSAQPKPSAVELYILWAQRELVSGGGRRAAARLDRTAGAASGLVTPFGRPDR